jgi:hypothetical protein
MRCKGAGASTGYKVDIRTGKLEVNRLISVWKRENRHKREALNNAGHE